MIYPKFNLFTDLFWENYIRFIIKSDFHEFITNWAGESVETESLLILGNHFSWWDGFLIYELNRKHFKKRFHVMMTEEQLQKHKFLRTAGAYSINKQNPRKMLESLSYSAKLLEDPNNLVLMFPQGQIESQHRQAITFQSGLMRIIKQTKAPFQVLFCSNQVDYYSNRKPTLKAFMKLYNGGMSLREIQKAFLSHHQESKEKMSEVIS